MKYVAFDVHQATTVADRVLVCDTRQVARQGNKGDQDHSCFGSEPTRATSANRLRDSFRAREIDNLARRLSDPQPPLGKIIVPVVPPRTGRFNGASEKLE